jgi:murein DD-endopeptidase MepM/ murein hydrolase activator NlpD
MRSRPTFKGNIMKIYRPVKRNLCTQKFGLANTNPSVLPLYKQLGLDGHDGLDFLTENGDDVRFNFGGKGVVQSTKIDSSGGLGVSVLFENNGKHYKTIYWHLKEFKVKTGDAVESGTLLGLADNTGMSTGSHLHFGLYETDKNGDVINYNNGYRGAMDPNPFIQNIYILDELAYLEGQIKVIQLKIIETLKKLLGK